MRCAAGHPVGGHRCIETGAMPERDTAVGSAAADDEIGQAMPDVVVGVDSSQHSLVALRTAADEARCRASRLHVVYVYEPTQAEHIAAAAAVMAGDVSMVSTADTVLHEASRRDDEDRAEARRHAEGRLRQFVSGASTDLAGLDVQQSAIGDEHPAAALVRLSRGAELLVIGSRGVGGFVGLLLGSVGQQCVHHATCSVLVARA